MRKGGILLFILLLQCISNYCQGQIIAGPLNPGTITTGSCSFSYSSVLSYAPTGNVVTSNNVYATAVHCACCDANTNCLRLTNFGFSIPAGAIITGILVEIEKRSDPGSQIEDNGLRLLQNGNEIGSNLANYGIAWPSSDTYLSYGGCSNLWGASWTATDINAANFGLVFASIDYSCLGNITSFIDHVRVSVCYNITLPIDLVYFKGKREKDQVILNWGVLSEKSKDFIIEYSSDGQLFSEIGNLKSSQNHNGLNKFEYKHFNTQPTVSYYRLKTFDKSIKDYSHPISIEPYSGSDIKFYPNPCNTYVYIQSAIDTPFSIHDLFGKIILSGEISQKQQRIELTEFPSGIYILRIADKFYKLEILH